MIGGKEVFNFLSFFSFGMFSSKYSKSFSIEKKIIKLILKTKVYNLKDISKSAIIKP